jgi:hydrogenase/urease accessory protein HupE
MAASMVRGQSRQICSSFFAARSILAVLICGGARPASAHQADIIYVHLQKWVAGDWEERAILSNLALAQLVPEAAAALERGQQESAGELIDAQIWSQMPLSSGAVRCDRGPTWWMETEGYIELSARFRCPEGELKQSFQFLELLPQEYRVIVGTELGGNRIQRFADKSAPTVVLSDRAVSGEARRPEVRGLQGWFQLGVAHIFGGLDHLAFLLALLIVGGGWKRMLLMVTAFTAAHSLTLGATALEVIDLDATRQRWAEIAIAASIVYVAFENLVLKQHDHRAWITFGFGLVHGFGFASVLKGYGLGHSRALGLLGFNLGVEAGQACIVAAIYPAILILQRRPSASRWMVRLSSVLILSAGGYWLVDRVSG